MINILLRGKTTDKRRPVAGLHESKPVGLTGTSNKKMSSNIEIKAKVGDPGRACWLAEAISDTCPVRIGQNDTFFFCSNGRLKLRQTDAKTAELIFYSRPKSRTPKRSDYNIYEIANPENLRALLAKALGIQATVIKTRTLFMVGQTRIHLDFVEGLGSFVELEVVLQDPESTDEGHAIARKLMDRLEIKDCDLVGGSYVDLLPNSSTAETVHCRKDP